MYTETHQYFCKYIEILDLLRVGQYWQRTLWQCPSSKKCLLNIRLINIWYQNKLIFEKENKWQSTYRQKKPRQNGVSQTPQSRKVSVSGAVHSRDHVAASAEAVRGHFSYMWCSTTQPRRGLASFYTRPNISLIKVIWTCPHLSKLVWKCSNLSRLDQNSLNLSKLV